MEEIGATSKRVAEYSLSVPNSQLGLLGSAVGMGASYVYGLKPTVLYVIKRSDVPVFSRLTS